MLISKTFNMYSQQMLAIKNLVHDKDTKVVFGAKYAPLIEEAKAYFNGSGGQNPENSKYRAFALPLLDRMAEITDPSFHRTGKGKNTDGRYFDWIFKNYLQSVAMDTPIKSEDLQKIRDELIAWQNYKELLESHGKNTDVNAYGYDDFTDIIRNYMSGGELRRRIDNAPQDVLDETSILYHGQEGSILVPHTHNASRYFGSVNWCISYKNTDENFKDYNKKSPILMYIPNPNTIALGDANLITGKVAVVDQVIYNEKDTEVDQLPSYIHQLRRRALETCAPSVCDYLREFGDFQEIDSCYSNIQTQVKENPYLDRLSAEQRELLAGVEFVTDFCDVFENHPDLSQDEDFMLACVNKNGRALEFADPKLRKNREIVMAAVQQNGWGLEYADPELQKDHDFILQAIALNVDALSYCDETLFNDCDFVQRLFDLLEDPECDQKTKIIGHLHKVPALFGHIGKSVSEMREHVKECEWPHEFSLKHEQLEV